MKKEEALRKIKELENYINELDNKKDFDYKTIKTFEDACYKVGVKPTDLPEVSMLPLEFQKAIINCYKLYIIFKAVNNGWTPDWNNSNQYKYYPYFRVLSSFLDFDVAFYECGSAYSVVGSRLCCETSDKAKYIGQQFENEYKEFLLNSK